MTPRDDLHQLIHALTTAERRYFKLQARLQESQGEWNYLKLFDALDKQKAYDEALIKEQFKGTKIEKNLAVEKHYLYMQLLKALRNFRARKRKDMELREMIDGIEIMTEKGLEGPAWHLLRRAKKLALKLDQPLELIEIHVLERRMGKMVKEKKGGRKLDEMDEEGRHLVERLRKEVAFHSLYDRFSSLITQGHDLRKSSRQETLQRALAHPLLQDASAADSLFSRSLFLQIKANGAFLLGDTSTALQHYRSIADLWRRHPHAIQRYPRRFLNVLVNYMTGLESTGNYEAIPPVLQQIRQLKRRFGLKASHNDTSEFHFELLLQINSGNLDAAKTAADELSDFIQAFEGKLDMTWKLPSAFNLSAVYFVTGTFRKALAWTNYIMQVEPTQKRETLQHIARIFQLVLHLELDNHDLLEYLLRNSKAYLKRRGAMDRFETVVLETVKSLLAAASPSEKKDLTGKLLRKLQEEFTSNLPGLDELKIWARAKVENRPIAKVAEEVLKKE